MSAVTKEMIPGIVATGASARIEKSIAASFKVGDQVRTININPATHTRLPRYARQKNGIVVIDHGVFITPDKHAHGQGEFPQHLYNIVFSSEELWGAEAVSNDKVHIDLWEEYLEKVES